jgi:hypothetical protein
MGYIGDGKHPRHWHKSDQGRPPGTWKHRMKDPRTIEGWKPEFWDEDERAYVAHLREHEARQADPQRAPDDDEVITALFDKIETDERVIAKQKAMIVALRQQELEKNEG